MNSIDFYFVYCFRFIDNAFIVVDRLFSFGYGQLLFELRWFEIHSPAIEKFLMHWKHFDLRHCIKDGDYTFCLPAVLTIPGKLTRNVFKCNSIWLLFAVAEWILDTIHLGSWTQICHWIIINSGKLLWLYGDSLMNTRILMCIIHSIIRKSWTKISKASENIGKLFQF